jgi:hypothetical protein
VLNPIIMYNQKPSTPPIESYLHEQRSNSTDDWASNLHDAAETANEALEEAGSRSFEIIVSY